MTDSLSFIQQALNDYAATLAPSARAGFTVLANHHYAELQRALAQAAAPVSGAAPAETTRDAPAAPAAPAVA